MTVSKFISFNNQPQCVTVAAVGHSGWANTVTHDGCREPHGSSRQPPCNHRGPRWLVFSRENTHICNGMYSASTTLTKLLTY
jgi:hypothetical protein